MHWKTHDDQCVACVCNFQSAIIWHSIAWSNCMHACVRLQQLLTQSKHTHFTYTFVNHWAQSIWDTLLSFNAFSTVNRWFFFCAYVIGKYIIKRPSISAIPLFVLVLRWDEMKFRTVLRRMPWLCKRKGNDMRPIWNWMIADDRTFDWPILNHFDHKNERSEVPSAHQIKRPNKLIIISAKWSDEMTSRSTNVDTDFNQPALIIYTRINILFEVRTKRSSVFFICRAHKRGQLAIILNVSLVHFRSFCLVLRWRSPIVSLFLLDVNPSITYFTPLLISRGHPLAISNDSATDNNTYLSKVCLYTNYSNCNSPTNRFAIELTT